MPLRSPLTREVPERIAAGSRSVEPASTSSGPGRRSGYSSIPARTRAAIATCGASCPGLNNVLRSVFLELYHRYGVRDVLGIRYGYAESTHNGHEPAALTCESVDHIHMQGGTVLGSSRGPVDPAVALDLFKGWESTYCSASGGDERSGATRADQEANRRGGYPLAVVGIPKTVDNDIEYVWRAFGFATAVEEAAYVIDSAHAEAKSALNGVGLVKLMGRDAGFIACGATLASQEVNFTLIPKCRSNWKAKRRVSERAA